VHIAPSSTAILVLTVAWRSYDAARRFRTSVKKYASELWKRMLCISPQTCGAPVVIRRNQIGVGRRDVEPSLAQLSDALRRFWGSPASFCGWGQTRQTTSKRFWMWRLRLAEGNRPRRRAYGGGAGCGSRTRRRAGNRHFVDATVSVARTPASSRFHALMTPSRSVSAKSFPRTLWCMPDPALRTLGTLSNRSDLWRAQGSGHATITSEERFRRYASRWRH